MNSALNKLGKGLVDVNTDEVNFDDESRPNLLVGHGNDGESWVEMSQRLGFDEEAF